MLNMPPFRCPYSSLKEVPNACALQQEHKEMMLVAQRKAALSSLRKGREAKRDRDSGQNPVSKEAYEGIIKRTSVVD